MGESKTRPSVKTAGKAARKPAAAKCAPARPRTRKASSAAAETAGPGARISPEERHRLISEAAYLRAQARSHGSGSPEQDWLVAEVEIDSRLLGRG